MSAGVITAHGTTWREWWVRDWSNPWRPFTLPVVDIPWTAHLCNGRLHTGTTSFVCSRREGHTARHLALDADGQPLAVWGDRWVPGHRQQIRALRREADWLDRWGDGDEPDVQATALRAVAALLECHDATGINITNNWPEVEAFVNLHLAALGFPPVADNHA